MMISPGALAKIVRMKQFSCLFFFVSTLLASSLSLFLWAEKEEAPIHPPLYSSGPITEETKEKGYTINFNNVSILEYLKFVGQIAKVNFIYQENELNFNVTITSEGETQLVEIMGALVQVLRINGFNLIEQGSNFLITRSEAAQQIATVFSENMPPRDQRHIPPIMTYVFKVENSSPGKIKSLLSPFLSDRAITEASEESGHLIITDLTQNIEQIQKLMNILDVPDTHLDVSSYAAKYNRLELLISLAKQIVDPLSKGNPLILVPQTNTQTIFIVSTPSLIEKTISILEDLDLPPSIASSFQGTLTGSNLLLYHIQHKSVGDLENALTQITSDFDKTPNTSQEFIRTLKSMKYIRVNHSLLFIGDENSISAIKKILTDLDLPYGDKDFNSIHQGFYIYPIKFSTESEIQKSLNQLVDNLDPKQANNKTLIAVIRSMKWIQETNALLFLGEPHVLETISQLLPLFDVAVDKSTLPLSSDFFIYKPKSMSAIRFLEVIEKIRLDLSSSGLVDPSFLEALQSGKISADDAVIFTGDPNSLGRVQTLISLIEGEAAKQKIEEVVFIYKIEYADYNYIQQELDQLSQSLIPGSALRQAIENADYLAEANSFFFRGSQTAIDQIKQLLTNIDHPTTPRAKNNEFFIYHPVNTYPEDLLHAIQEMVQHMRQNGFSDHALLTTLKTAQLSSNQKGILFVGSATSIARIKELLPSIDIPSAKKGSAMQEKSQFFVYHPLYKTPKEVLVLSQNMAKDMEIGELTNIGLINALQSAQLTANQKAVLFTGTESSITDVKELLKVIDVAQEFFIYRPVHVSAEAMQKGSIELAEDMQLSGAAKEELLDSLKNVQITSNGKAVLFTGSSETILGIKSLLPSLDAPSFAPDTSSFFVYKVKYVPGPTLVKDLKENTTSLPLNNAVNQQVAAAIHSMRFIETTNSIIFTGTPQALERIKALISHFDTPSGAPPAKERTVSGYKIYTPITVSGDQLVQMLQDFQKSLANSGVDKPALFDVITHLQWMPATNSILLSGDLQAVDETYSLLKKFDVEQEGPGRTTTSSSDIEQVADMSFLIYKLEYHSGADIVLALKQIGEDLKKSQITQNEKIFNAINTMQWISITNSLITTGEPATLAKLRQLIQSIDIPVKQVFVEILILETTIGDALNFGLRWGSQGQYKNRFAYGTGSFPQNTTNDPDNLSAFQQNLSTISATTTPTGSFIPFSSGFDFGVIGDIILHKGQSYFSLGSLVDALRSEGNSTIVTNQKLVTQDNRNSTLFVGSNIPYTGSFVTNTSNQTIQTANLEYRDIGVNLSITPSIGNNDIITLNIEQDISELVNPNIGNTTSTDSVTGITTSKTSSRTVVSVPNQSFLVLSGQIQNSTVSSKTGIPCLGGLPILGAFFSQNDYQKNVTNLIIFVRPHIIKTFDEYKEITTKQEDVYRAQTDDPESFDAALELVKTPDDF